MTEQPFPQRWLSQGQSQARLVVPLGQSVPWGAQEDQGLGTEGACLGESEQLLGSSWVDGFAPESGNSGRMPVSYLRDCQNSYTLFEGIHLGTVLGHAFAPLQVLAGDRWEMLIHPDDRVRCRLHQRRLNKVELPERAVGESLVQVIEGQADRWEPGEAGVVLPLVDLRCRLRDGQGQWCWLQFREAVLSRTSSGAPWQVVGSVEVLRDEQGQGSGLAGPHLWHPLTALPNRLLLAHRLAERLTAGLTAGLAERLKLGPAEATELEPPLLVGVALDCEQSLRPYYGTWVSEQVLLKAVRRLQRCLADQDVLVHLEGDRFAVLLAPGSTGVRALELADAVQRQFQRPFASGGQDIVCHSYVGILPPSPWSEATVLTILQSLEAVLSQAQSHARSSYCVYDPSRQHERQQQLQLEAQLQRALERRELVLYYQPLIDLKGDRLVGFEALVRWQHPERGLVFPNDFIPLAEATGLIVPLGEFVFEQACWQLKTWLQQCPHRPPLLMGVNLSARQLMQPQLLATVDGILARTGVPGQMLHLEITETAAVEDMGVVLEQLQGLRQRGIHLSLDDFGTGYSSLSYLDQFPVDILKIDRSFVQRIQGPQQSSSIIEAIVSLAQRLGLAIVAEGIETAVQLEYLRELGCDYAQGHYFARALTISQALDWIKQVA